MDTYLACFIIKLLFIYPSNQDNFLADEFKFFMCEIFFLKFPKAQMPVNLQQWTCFRRLIIEHYAGSSIFLRHGNEETGVNKYRECHIW